MHGLFARSGGRDVLIASLVLALLFTMVLPGSPALFARNQEAASPAPDPVSSLSFAPVADATVLVTSPSQNFGNKKGLSADLDPRSEVYLRFDVNGVNRPISRATLWFWVTNPTSDGAALWTSPHVAWAESEVTWNTRPAVDDFVGNLGEVPSDSWIQYDVTGTLRGDGSYTYALLAETSDGMDINSREAGENQPLLVIDMEDLASPVPLAGDVPVLLAAGDIAECDLDTDEQTAQILANYPGTIAALGDNVYDDGTAEEFANCYDPSWGQYKDRILPAVGNHEYRTDNAGPYFDYFGAAAGERGKGWYSYDIGTWHIVVLNSNLDKIDPAIQEQWLIRDLAAHPVQCTLAYWHHPRFSSGEHGNNEYIDPLYTLIYQNGVDVLLVGHDHNYERFAPQNPDGQVDDEYGVRQITVGTGGTHFRPLEGAQPSSEAQNDTTHGVLRMELNPGSYTWEFLPVAGGAFTDAGSDNCHDAPASAAPSGVQHQDTWAWLGPDTRSTFVAGRFRTH